MHHTTSIEINVDFETVYKTLSNPENYKEIYPFWVKDVKHKENDTYHVYNQDGSDFEVLLKANKEYGVIDCLIGEEASRLRVFPAGDAKVLVIHVAVRWNGMTDEQWLSHCKGVDSDFESAKKWIENLYE